MHPNALLDHASELTRRVLKLDHPADAVVSRYFREHRALGQRERATLAETAYAVLRHKLLFEHLARTGTGGRERRLAILGFHAPREFLKQVLSEPERRWLDACDAIDRAGLAAPLRHNLPAWLAERLQARLGAEFEPLASALLESARVDLRVNTLKEKRLQALASLAEHAIKSVETPYSPWGLRLAAKPALHKLDLFTSGAIEVQDEGSQLLALLLDARRGEMVADFCAGAGGKTLAIGATMRNTGRLYAFDVAAHRLEALKPRLARSGLSNVHPVALAHERDERLKRLVGKFDRVLVDAPCSGLGTLRRNPDLKWRQSPEAVEQMQAKQQAILASAARLVRPGGRLVYATCSLLAEENEEVVASFDAAQQRDFVPLDAAELLGALKVPAPDVLCAGGPAPADEAPVLAAHGAAADGAARPQAGGAASAPEAGEARGPGQGRFLRLWPHRHGTDGFFAAVWQRAG